LTRIKPGPEGLAIILRSPRILSMASLPLTFDSPVATPSGAEGEAAIADDPELQAGFTSWERAGDGRRVARSHLLLAGLWCAGCAGAIERALRAEPGVLEASASYASLRATVVWDPAAARVSGLLAAVRRAGYDAAPDAAASARALRQADERKALWRRFVAVFCMMQVMMYQAPLYVAAPGTLSADLRTLLLWAAWLLSIPVLLFSAAPMFRDAWEAMRRRRIGMDLPVSIGILITFVVSTGATFAPGGAFGAEPYFDSLTMFVAFMLAGRYLALKARHRVAASLEGALSRLPSAVRRLASDGTVELVGLHLLASGDRVRVLAGEAFPADGPLETAAEVDEALLTGESRPVAKQPGEEAIAGSFNLAGPVVQRVERLGADTRYAGIVSLMRTAMSARPPLLRAADRIAGPFLWGVLLLAAWAGAAWSMIDPSRAVWVMVSVLIVTCPCALSLAAPSALLAAAGALIRRGVLVQRFDALEGLAALDTICFDKTGTITEACPQMLLAELQSAGGDAGFDEAGARAIAGLLATSSNHPLSAALAAQASAVPAPLTFNHVTEFPGFGVQAIGSDNRVYRLGAVAWATRGLAESIATAGPETWLGGPGGAIARFAFAEVLRADASQTMAQLRSAGLELRLLSGDAAERVHDVARRLGIAEARGHATPADKLEAIAAMQADGRRVAMVGDGLNDAPVMARADVSFAIGEGPALTRSNADFVLLSGRLGDIAEARRISQRAMRIVRQNMAWAVAYNLTCVPLALLGLFPPWAAGLGMAASSLFVVLNALRVDRRPRSPGRAMPEAAAA
jgi:Cu2+-exporting ATPase